jgi:hypothetical protein
MQAQPIPTHHEVPGIAPPIDSSAGLVQILPETAVVLAWRPRAASGAAVIHPAPYYAPGDRLGSARGLLLGLVLGAFLWIGIGVTIYRLVL